MFIENQAAVVFMLRRNLCKLIGVLFLIPLPTHSASFNCAKASTLVEHLICSDNGLSSADDQLAKLYKKNLKINHGLVEQQKLWLKQRNTCKDVECVSQAYQTRLSELIVDKSQSLTRPKFETMPSAPLLPDKTTVQPVTKEILDNISVKVYYADGNLLEYKLKNGSYTETPPYQSSNPENVDISMIAFGDLNGDKVDDAAIIVSYYSGGNVVAYSLTAVIAKAGKVLVTVPVDLGIKVNIKQFRIQSGKIIFNGIFLGENDSLCCPTQKVTYTYRVKNGSLVGQKHKG
jgi:uncharacterized protein